MTRQPVASHEADRPAGALGCAARLGARIRKTLARFAPALALLWAAACDTPGTVEPIPSPAIEGLRVSALSADTGLVAVAGAPETVPAGTVVALVNTVSGIDDRRVADASGAFVLFVPATAGDSLLLSAAGHADTDLSAERPGAGAPTAPGAHGVFATADPVGADGLVRVSGRGRCVQGGVVVVATNPARATVAETTAGGDGSFTLSLGAGPGEPLLLFTFARRERRSSAPVVVPVPLGVDADQDGTDAALDCDDSSPDRGPRAPEQCNGDDDDCDGEIDEGCVGRECDVAQGDLDSDGIGDACDADRDGDGVAADGGDCNDGNAGFGPTVPEICGNGRDEDCTGGADDGCPAESLCLNDAECGNQQKCTQGACQPRQGGQQPGQQSGN